MAESTMKCMVAGCRTRFKQAGKHRLCPGHADCYVAGQYDPFTKPCLPCIAWLRGFANPLSPDLAKLQCVSSLKDWFRRILRRNKDQGYTNVACNDPVLLELLKSKRFYLPKPEPMQARLRAIRFGIEADFPELPSPNSRSSTPTSAPPPSPTFTPAPVFERSFAEVTSPSGSFAELPQSPMTMPL